MTLSEAQTQLTEALAALSEARKAIAVGHKDRSVTRAGLSELRGEVSYWQRVVNEMTAAAAGQSDVRIKRASWS